MSSIDDSKIVILIGVATTTIAGAITCACAGPILTAVEAEAGAGPILTVGKIEACAGPLLTALHV